MTAETNADKFTSGDGPFHRITERSTRVREQARGLASELEGGLGDVEKILREELESHPYATLGSAAGLGMVLGALVPLRATGALVLFGSRLMMIALAQRVSTQKGAVR